MIKTASAYVLREKVWIQGDALTTEGMRSGYGEMSIDDVINHIGIGNHVIDAFNQFGTVIPHPTTREEMLKTEKQILDAVGVKTKSVFTKQSRYLSLRLENNQVIVTPTKHGTPQFRRGYIFLEDKALTSNLDPENLGRTLIKAFESCE